MDLGVMNARVNLVTTGFAQGINDIKRGFTKIQRHTIALNQALELAQKGFRALGKGFEFVETGAKLRDIEASFSNIAKIVGMDSAKMVAQLKTATRGSITELQAMAVTTQGILAGMQFDDLTTSIKYLQQYAKATDKDFQQLTRTIMTGLARGSVLMLDDAGIIIDQQTLMAAKAKEYGHSLTELEKKHVLVAEAIRQMKEKLPALGGELETTYDHFQKMKSYWNDYINILKKWSVQGLGAVFAGFGKLVEGFYTLRIALVKLEKAFDKTFKNIAITVNQKMMDVMISLRNALGASAAGLVNLDNPIANTTRAMLSTATSALDYGLEKLFDKNMEWTLSEAELNQKLKKLMAERANIISNNQANIDMMMGRGVDQKPGSTGLSFGAPSVDGIKNTFLENQKAMQDALQGLVNEGALIGLSETEAAMESIRQQFEAMVLLNPELETLYNQLKDTAVVNVLKEQEQALKDQVTALSSWAGVFKNALDGMVDAFTNSLRDMIDSGKLSLSGLVETFTKELTLYAARHAAELSMIAIKEVILGAVSTATRDYSGAAQHYSAAKLAGAGALKMGAFAAGALSGMAHDGISSIPEDGTWLLKKNERVVDSQTNADLKKYLKDGGGNRSIVQNVTINGGDQEGVMKALPAMKEMMISVVSEDIANGGIINRTISAYAR